MKHAVYILLLFSLQTHAQDLVKIQPGATFAVTGNTHITLRNMSFDNDGIFLRGSGTLSFTGSTDAQISGSGPMLFNNIYMNKTGGGKLSLQKDIFITSGISFNSGNIDLNGRNIVLALAALLNNESDDSRVVGSAGGYVEIAATLNAPVAANPGNLGVVITSTQNLGFTTIRRGHTSQKNGYNLGNTILRYYDIEPANNNNLNATLRFNYLEPELNTLSEPLLSLWSSANSFTWSSLGFSSLNTTVNFVEKSAINTMARFTLSTVNNPLPLRFISFNVHCNYNEVDLQWKTADEVNASHFIVERSADGVNYQGIANIPAGKNNYQYKDGSPVYGRTYYRIAAIDLDGSKQYTGINNNSCNSSEGLQLAPNPAQHQTWVTINTPTAAPVNISLYNNRGQLVQTYRNTLAAGSNQLPLNIQLLPAGTYHGLATWGTQQQSFTLVKAAK